MNGVGIFSLRLPVCSLIKNFIAIAVKAAEDLNGLSDVQIIVQFLAGRSFFELAVYQPDTSDRQNGCHNNSNRIITGQSIHQSRAEQSRADNQEIYSTDKQLDNQDGGSGNKPSGHAGFLSLSM